MTNFTARLEATCFRPSQLLPPNLPEIAFMGRSNVGKSSLINAVLKSRLAKTSSTPGKTRSINFYIVNNKFRFVDLPGYGYAAGNKDDRNQWQSLIASYLENRDNLKMILQLVDFRHGLLDNDKKLQEWLKSFELERKIFVVFTKADKIAKGKWRTTLENYLKRGLYSFDIPIITSSDSQAGLEKLKDFLIKNIGAEKECESEN